MLMAPLSVVVIKQRHNTLAKAFESDTSPRRRRYAMSPDIVLLGERRATATRPGVSVIHDPSDSRSSLALSHSNRHSFETAEDLP